VNLLVQATIFLAAATVLVPLFRRLGLGTVLGYLVAGVLIGPWGLRLVPDTESVLHFAEIGIVFLLFLIGLELNLSRLRVLRRTVFGLGSAQMVACSLALGAAAWWLGAPLPAAALVGFGLSLSSTAFVLQLLAEKKALGAPHGRSAFGVLLFQDLAVIPALALLPLLGTDGAPPAGAALVREIATELIVLAAMLIGGRYLLRPALRLLAATGVPEIFAAAALLLVIGAALLMETVGLSAGLGGFLAGVLVADSEYRHQLEADIAPFKNLLLGLFFIAVGMSTDLGLLLREPLLLLGLAAGLLAIKVLALYPLARRYGLAGDEARTLALTLAQGGEFAFVLFAAAVGEGVLPPLLAEGLIVVVSLSMAASPLIYAANAALLAPHRERGAQPFDHIQDDEPQVIIAGFGRFGQIIGRILTAQRIPFTALEINPSQVDFVRRFGSKIYYGDAGRLDLLRAARADKAKLFVLAVDDVEHSVHIAEAVRRHFPNLPIYARARNRQHAMRLMALGANAIIRETLLSSLWLAGQVLRGLRLGAAAAERATRLFAEHDQRTLEQQFAIRDDEVALIQSSRQSAAQLRQLFESDTELRGGG
jgi:glutathione-regulated potassium-efflux system ancillary protein KefC/glutathione-regulated potassium-efflux system protein KefB